MFDHTRDGLVYLGLDADQSRLLEEYVERLRHHDPSLPEDDRSAALQQQLDQLTAEVDAWKDRGRRADCIRCSE